jgi:hypothetical protein
MKNIFMGALQQASTDENVERFNRARDYFGDTVKRWNDRVTLAKGISVVEEYCRGRVAFIVLKADTLEHHKLEHWDQELMLIHDVQIVHSPEGKIPSLVGLYRVQDKGLNGRTDLLIFESAVKGGYKFLPRIPDWESCPLGWIATTSHDDLVVQEIKSTPEIMQSVSHDQRCVHEVERASIDFEPEKLCANASIFKSLRVAINMDAVEVGFDEIDQHQIEIVDVLQRPFNLFV